MSDGEPEPFSMSTDPEVEDAEVTEPDTEPEPDDEVVGENGGNGRDGDDGSATLDGAEDIDDLIDEASRPGADAVWAAAAEASSSQGMWSDDPEADVWAEQEEEEAPLAPAPTPDEDPRTSPHRGPPAASEGMDHLPPADEGPEAFTFALGDETTGEEEAPPASAPQPRPHADQEEPEPFRFGAGPETSAPMPVQDAPAADDTEEPEAFSFPVDDTTAGDDTPADEAGEPAREWTVPPNDAADGDQDPDHDLWTFDVTPDTAETDEPDAADAPLSESAHPRTDAGWRDLDAEEEPSWSVPDLPLRRRDDVDEPSGFAASVGDDTDDDAPWSSGPVGDDTDDDAPWTSGPAGDDTDDDAPWTSGPAEDGDGDVTDDVERPAGVVTAEVHDALGDLLGNEAQGTVGGGAGPAGAPAPTGDAAPVPAEDAAPVPAEDAAPTGDPLDELADLDLDQFDDLGSPAATADAATDVDAASDVDAPTDADTATDDDQESADPDDDTEADEQPLDAPTAAREVMQPGSVSFSSGGKKKKRGFFG